jgi:DNA-binding response OmpR family regulator
METAEAPTVLIIEDEDGLREILEVNLRWAGYRVTGCGDGLAAWQHFERERPDLVLLDLNLPQMSGFRLLELIREDSRLPIIIITAFDFAEAEEVARFRPNAYIKKPFDPDDVVALAAMLLAGRHENDSGQRGPG